MKIFQLRDYTKEELMQKKHELEEELFNLRLKKMTKQLENPLILRNLKRDIARINTILNEDEKGIRKLAGESEIKKARPSSGKKE